MSTIFTVTCPQCSKTFPVHTELWQAGYDLLCPFCQAMFPQSKSPTIVTGKGETFSPATTDTGQAESM